MDRGADVVYGSDCNPFERPRALKLKASTRSGLERSPVTAVLAISPEA